MDFEKAINILELPNDFEEGALKKAYYKKALRYHPDKNSDAESSERFKEVGAAYQFLRDKKNLIKERFPNNFQELMKRCLDWLHLENKWEDIFINTTLQSMLINCKEISLKVFEKLQKERALEVYDFLTQNKELFSISDLISGV